MEISVNSQGFATTPSLRDFATERIRKSCGHLPEPPTHCRAHLGKTGSGYQVELDLRYQGKDFSASSKDNDLHVSITNAASRMRRQLENHTTKSNSHR